MTDLLIVRHAIAHDHDPAQWPDDSLRPLTAEGIDAFRKAARGAAAIGLRPATVWTSRFVRARQTAEILESAAGWPAAAPMEALESERAAALVEALGAAAGPDRVAIVGHEPTLSGAIEILCGAVVEMKKGSIARLDVVSFSPGGAVLRALLPPKALRAAAAQGTRSAQSSAG